MIGAVLILSLVASGVAVLLPGYGDVLLLSGPVAIAALLVLLRQRRNGPAKAHVIIDGSNVMHWNGGQPSLDPVIEVIRLLTAQGLTAGVMFDANVGYKIGDRYQDDAEVARRLGLPAERVLVVAKGTQADQVILQAARDLGAQVVSNDRFRDWAEGYPEVTRPGFLIRGGLRDGKVWVETTAPAA